MRGKCSILLDKKTKDTALGIETTALEREKMMRRREEKVKVYCV